MCEGVYRGGVLQGGEGGVGGLRGGGLRGGRYNLFVRRDRRGKAVTSAVARESPEAEDLVASVAVSSATVEASHAG